MKEVFAMKRLFKLALASCTAVSLFGSPLMTLANTDSDELKDELCEHYWFDKEDSKIYSFDEQGQWKAYDSTSQDIKISIVDDTDPSENVLKLTPETGKYDYNDGHVTIHEDEDETMELDILSLVEGHDQIKDEAVYDAIQDYTGDYILYDEVNTSDESPCDYMVQMKEKADDDSEDTSNTSSTKNDDESSDTAGKNVMNENNETASEESSDQQSSTTESDQSTQEETTVDQNTMNKIATSTLAEASPVYIAGNVYHADMKCAGDNYSETTLKQAVKDGYTPCEKEFSYDGYSFSTEAGKETKNTINESNVNVNIEVVNVENNVLVVNEANTNEATETSEEDLVNVNGKIVWKDNKNEYKVRPSKVTVILYRNGEQYKAIDVSGDATSESWSFGFEKLAKKDESGNEYKYTIKEKSLAYYRGDLDGYVLTNTYVGQAPTTSSGSHTGTQTNMTLYAGVGLAAVAVVIVLIVMNKKKQAK